MKSGAIAETVRFRRDHGNRVAVSVVPLKPSSYADRQAITIGERGTSPQMNALAEMHVHAT
jgi:hypothetical protein